MKHVSILVPRGAFLLAATGLLKGGTCTTLGHQGLPDGLQEDHQHVAKSENASA